MADQNPRLMRMVDYLAEMLEAEASKIPQTYKERGDSLRKMADSFRMMDNPNMVRIWEVPEPGSDK
jgi:hypothetical protein